VAEAAAVASAAAEAPCNEVVLQIAFSDRILINKKDLVTSADMDVVEARVRGINGVAKLFWTERGQVDLDQILGTHSFSLDRAQETEAATAALTAGGDAHTHAHDHAHGDGASDCGQCCAAAGCSDPAHAHGEDGAAGEGEGHSHDHGHGADEEAVTTIFPAGAGATPRRSLGAVHSSGVGTVCVSESSPVSLDKLNQWLGGMLWEGDGAADIFRVKGVIDIAGSDLKHVVQGVHELFECEPVENSPWQAGEERASKIVFIGKNLDAEKLAAGLRDCCE
jgi:G3E family GTPase